LNTKIHTVIDHNGIPLCFLLSPGNDHDSKHAVAALQIVDITGVSVLGDKAYGSKEILGYIREHGGKIVIPPKSNTREPWYYDKETYKHRNVVERFFQRLKWFRCVATRYDKTDSSFLSFVYIAAIVLLLKLH